jgi:hypothetical protein
MMIDTTYADALKEVMDGFKKRAAMINTRIPKLTNREQDMEIEQAPDVKKK